MCCELVVEPWFKRDAQFALRQLEKHCEGVKAVQCNAERPQTCDNSTLETFKRPSPDLIYCTIIKVSVVNIRS